MRKLFERTITFIRPLWFSRYGLFGAPFGLYYSFKYAFSRLRGGAFARTYAERKAVFDNISCLDDLAGYFHKVYEYKPDLLGGLLDHHAGDKEFFGAHGDCDDVALYTILALKRLNKRYGERYECYFATVFPPSLQESHNDCFFYDKVQRLWYAFDYGDLRCAASKEELEQAYQKYMCKEAPEKVNIYLRKK